MNSNAPTSELCALSDRELLMRLSLETQAARRIYAVEGQTRCDSVMLDSGCELMLKREDLSQVHSYKWRGSFNKIASICDAGFTGDLICASAGNHAQGVAVAAARLQLKATIFMPLSTPLLKQQAVRDFGGQFVEIRLCGDSFDQASAEAMRFAEETGGTIIPPYDDLLVIAGQSMIGVEICNKLKREPTHAFLEIGGGGMAAGVASVLRKRYPNIKLIGVEAAGQNSMGISVAAGSRQTLDELDRFCDGTAVATPGELPFRFCAMLLDDFVTATNDEVCEAIQFLWQRKRIMVEPSAALGVAAANAYELTANDYAITVLSGSNVDFMALPKIAKRGQVNRPEERFFCFQIGEQPGALIGLLDQFFSNMNIIDFQYGKVANAMAKPVIGVEVPASDAEALDVFFQREDLPRHEEVTGQAATEFRVIPFRPDTLSHPFFAVVTFSNRPGALRDFMRGVSQRANVCYMNYTDSGQTEGQALMGFEFDDEALQFAFINWLTDNDIRYDAIAIEQVLYL
jgi:threonine dehydratase